MTAPKSLRELFDQLGLQEVPSTDGTVTMEMPVDERTVNTAGGLQGGLIATMADVTCGCADPAHRQAVRGGAGGHLPRQRQRDRRDGDGELRRGGLAVECWLLSYFFEFRVP